MVFMLLGDGIITIMSADFYNHSSYHHHCHKTSGSQELYAVRTTLNENDSVVKGYAYMSII